MSLQDRQRQDVPVSGGLQTVLGKTFAILDALATDGEMSLAEIARSTGIPKSSVHRIAKRLTEWGGVEMANGSFRLGMHIFELSGAIASVRQLREIALPFIEDLYEATHEVVHLGILDGTEVIYLEKISGHQSLRVPTQVGGRMPAHCTGLGKALLSYASHDVIDRIVSKGMRPRTRYSIAAPNLLREQLADARANRFASDIEEAIVGVSCVASPVLSPSGNPIAALSVTMPSAKFRIEPLSAAVRSSADALAERLRKNRIRSIVPARRSEPGVAFVDPT